jgi:hypothetical protein
MSKGFIEYKKSLLKYDGRLPESSGGWIRSFLCWYHWFSMLIYQLEDEHWAHWWTQFRDIVSPRLHDHQMHSSNKFTNYSSIHNNSFH